MERLADHRQHIAALRELTPAELADRGWHERPDETGAVVLDDGSLLIPERDPEGNGAGAFHVVMPSSTHRLRLIGPGSLHLLGLEVVGVEPLRTAEAARFGWRERESAAAVVLEGDVRLVPARDEEGNGPGVLVIVEPGGEEFAWLAGPA